MKGCAWDEQRTKSVIMAVEDDGAKEDGDEDPSANQRVGEGEKRKIGGPSPCATKDFGPSVESTIL